MALIPNSQQLYDQLDFASVMMHKNTKRACPMGKPFIIYNKVVIVLVANYN
ncbi:hypothetical protein HMPREF6745_1420 [Prevotella sp. oral taxon 472 str. F0295]|nr:hypothetical protein HMPREF6745_1420 [Prevotella sp. oral taxon 472 str. F0295]